MKLNDGITPFYPSIGDFTFSCDVNVKLYDNEKQAHDDLLKTYFSAVREGEALTGKRMSDDAAQKEFLQLWKIWRLYVLTTNDGQDLPEAVVADEVT